MTSETVRVLLIEDNLLDVQMVEQFLKTHGRDRFRLDCVNTLSDGLQRLSRGDYDVVLLDLDLPDGKGVDALRAVRAGRAALPVVAMTDGRDEALGVAAISAGAQDHLVKVEFDGRLLVRSLRYATERKRIERELAAQRALLAAMLDTAGALIAVLDPHGRVLRFNRACRNLSGFALGEVVGKVLWDILLPEAERPAAREAFDRVLSSDAECELETHWVGKRGTMHLVSWRLTRLADPAGEAQGVVLTGIDITERRSMEDQLRRAARLEAVGQLAGGIAHDFNNLVTAILGYVDLNLPEIPAGTQLHQDMLRIRTAARRAADLTGRLLTFSRQRPAERKALDLSDVVAGLTDMMRRCLEENIDLRVETHTEPLIIEADPAQLEQLLLNLVLNARDAMPAGGALMIRTCPAEIPVEMARAHHGWRAGRYAALIVSDTGVGMTPDVKARMYEPFFTTKEPGRGTGLGLSIVWNIAQGHGALLDCQTAPGQGTTFSVYFPLSVGHTGGTEYESTAVPGYGQGETVLLVEDEAEVREAAARILGSWGYVVLTARDGREALQIAREHDGDIHLLLTDVVMPRLGGPELAQKVRLLRPSVKLLFMSGYGECDRTPVVHHLPRPFLLYKPFNPKDLLLKVREVLEAD